MRSKPATFIAHGTHDYRGKLYDAGGIFIGDFPLFEYLVRGAICAIGLWLCFANWMLGLALILAASTLLKTKYITGWHGECPVCDGEIILYKPENVGTYGADCPICKHRLILRDKQFHVAPQVELTAQPAE